MKHLIKYKFIYIVAVTVLIIELVIPFTETPTKQIIHECEAEKHASKLLLFKSNGLTRNSAGKIYFHYLVNSTDLTARETRDCLKQYTKIIRRKK